MNKINRITEFFDTNIALLKDEMIKLKCDNRQDESVFARVKMNVYDIFKTVFLTSVKLNGNNENKIAEFFSAKLNEIPLNWKASLFKAEEHNEAEKAHIENLKLGAAENIKENFIKIWKED